MGIPENEERTSCCVHDRDEQVKEQVAAFLAYMGLSLEDAKEVGRDIQEVLRAHRRWKKFLAAFWGFFGAVGAGAIINWISAKLGWNK